MAAAPVIWALTDGGTGMRAQAEGLAQHLAGVCGGNVVSGTARVGAIGKCVPAAAAAFGLYRLQIECAARPDIVIGCGVQAQAPVLAVKKKHRAFAVCVQRPVNGARYYDAIVAPQHDYTAVPAGAAAEKIILTLGAVGRIDNVKLAERREAARRRFVEYRPPYIGALIGGDNRAYTIRKDELTAQLQRIAADSGATLLITPSRRSSEGLVNHLQRIFGGRHFVWDGGDDNPYMDILAAAEGFCVTADSVNMLSEASAAGCAVYILPLTAKADARAARAARKFNTFHQALIANGNVRLYDGEWSFFTAQPLDETQRAVKQVWQLYQQTCGNC